MDYGGEGGQAARKRVDAESKEVARFFRIDGYPVRIQPKSVLLFVSLVYLQWRRCAAIPFPQKESLLAETANRDS